MHQFLVLAGRADDGLERGRTRLERGDHRRELDAFRPRAEHDHDALGHVFAAR
jgi:hypothetical protein